MKLHIGCGTIYLKGYVNIDASPNYLADDAPGKVMLENTTTFENYYKAEFCKGSGKTVADISANVCDSLPFGRSAASEVVMRQVLEHIPHYKLKQALGEVNRVLKHNGLFILSVPDTVSTARMLLEAKTQEEEDWCIRLLYGTQRNEYSHHFCGYTPRTLRLLLSENGFGNFSDLPNINFYPAIHLAARKTK